METYICHFKTEDNKTIFIYLFPERIIRKYKTIDEFSGIMKIYIGHLNSEG